MTTYEYVDPRTFAGDPFQVAEKALLQTSKAVTLLERALNDSEVMARNAEMERQIMLNGEPDALSWRDSGQGRKYAELAYATGQMQRQIKALQAAASYNPRAPKVL